jgi:hypothetical protein
MCKLPEGDVGMGRSRALKAGMNLGDAYGMGGSNRIEEGLESLGR